MDHDRAAVTLWSESDRGLERLAEAWRLLSQSSGTDAHWAVFLDLFAALGEAESGTVQSALATVSISGTYWNWCDLVVDLLRPRRDPGLLKRFWSRLFCLRFGDGAVPDQAPELSPTDASLGERLQAVRDRADLWRLAPALPWNAEAAPPGELFGPLIELLGRVVREPNPGVLPGGVLALTPVFAAGPGLAGDDGFVARVWALPLHKRLSRESAAMAPGTVRRVQGVLALFLTETLLAGRAQALISLAERLFLESSTTLNVIGEFLFRVGLYRSLTVSDWQAVRAAVPRNYRGFMVWILMLHIRTQAPAAWNRTVLDHWAWPLIRERAEAGDFSALNTLNIAVTVVQKQPFTEAHWRSVGDPYIALVQNAADRLLSGLAQDLPLAALTSETPLRIAFLSRNSLVGPPAITLTLFLSALLANCQGQVEPHVFFLCDRQPPLKATLEGLGVKATWLNDLSNLAKTQMDRTIVLSAVLRQTLYNSRFPVAVYYDSDDEFTIVSSTMRVAPVQIHWRMGFEWPGYRHMDGMFSVLPCETGSKKVVNDRVWHHVRHLYRPLVPAAAEIVAGIRDRFAGYRIVLGSICRSEKLNSPAFLAVLGRLLRRYPDACYLWTGSRDADIVTMMEQEGIADRCFFCGWVKAAEYMPVLDIFLDTFPQCNGLAVAEAMSIGKPVISRAGSYTFHNFIFEPARLGWQGQEEQRELQRLSAGPGGESLYLLANDDQAYEAMACRLIDDPAFYRAASAAAVALADRYLFNGPAAAESFLAAVRDVIVHPGSER